MNISSTGPHGKSPGETSDDFESPVADSAQLLARILSNPRLPSPPILALKIVERVSDPNSSVPEIANLLHRDAAMCGKLLKITNSALFGVSHPVKSVNEAVQILGFNRVRSLVLGLSLPAMQSRLPTDPGLVRFWRNSILNAVMARTLAHRLAFPNYDDELITGLMCDIGMLLLRQYFSEKYAPVWNGEVCLWGDQQCAWERRHLGIDHAEIGSALLQRWQLPSAIWQPIRFHHDTEPADLDPLFCRRARLLELSGMLVQLDQARSRPELLERIIQIARVRFSFELAHLESILAEMRPLAEEFAGTLELNIGDCPEYDTVLALGCEELVRLSMDRNNQAAMVGSDPSLERTGVVNGMNQLSTAGPAESSAADDVKSASTSSHHAMSADRSREFLEKLANDCRGARFQDFEVVEMIGRGAMGMVFKARDLKLDRHVAVKTLTPELMESTLVRQRFAREAQTTAKIRHDNVVSVYTVSEIHGVPFLVMEYVPGVSLQDWLNYGRKFSVKEIVSIGRQVASGLAAAHALRHVHRDIKPANILLEDASDRARITDFGLARRLDDDPLLSSHGALVGTPLFMSPEQSLGRPLDTMTDMFSLGSLLYTLCTGLPPFRGTSLFVILASVLEETPAAIPSLNPSIPGWLVEIISKLHSKDPAGRISAAELAELLSSRSLLSDSGRKRAT